MSTTDDGTRIGLGWEVWFLLGCVAVAGAVVPVLVGLIGGFTDPGTRPPPTGAPVDLDARRVVVGATAAAMFSLLAAALIRQTDWAISD
ncbi:MAG: hypothetical protein WD532_01255 [Acidimicrobiia bacterium]